MKAKVSNLWSKRETLLFAVIINLIVLSILLILYRPCFETNDDITISSIADGSKGFYDEHLVFLNRLLGYVLSWLYQTVRFVPWYAVLQYIITFVSFVAITISVMRRIKSYLHFVGFIAFLFVFAYENYIFLQFTKTAAVSTAAGILLLFCCLMQEKMSKGMLISGFLLALIGSFYRIDQFFAVFYLLTGIGLFIIIESWSLEKKLVKRRIISCVLMAAVLLISVCGMKIWDEKGYESAEWKDYLEYNLHRGQLYDYGFPDLWEYEERYQALGIDVSAGYLYGNWTHWDSEKFSLENMRQIVSWKEPKKVDAEFFRNFFKVIPKGILSIPCFSVVLMLVICWLFSKKRHVISLLLFTYEFFITLFLYGFLFFQGRYLMNRVDVGIWLSVSLFLLWNQWIYEKRVLQNLAVCFSVPVLILSFYMSLSQLRINQENEIVTMLEQRIMLEEGFRDKDCLYLKKVKMLDAYSCYGPFDRIPENLLNNVCCIGGWTVELPLEYELLEKYGVRNPLRDLVGREDIYLMDNDIELTMNYICRWYKSDAKAVLVRDLAGYPIYQIK